MIFNSVLLIKVCASTLVEKSRKLSNLFRIGCYNKNFLSQVKEKAKANAEHYCDKYGNYRMPFLWTGIHLIDVIAEAASGGDSASQGADKEQTLNREINSRRVIKKVILFF